MSNTLDPRQFWLDKAPKQRQEEYSLFFLKDRKTGAQFAPKSEIPKGMPAPFSPRRNGDGTSQVWWTVYDEDLDLALIKARDYGFRMNDEEVSLYGDPGLVVATPISVKIAGADTMHGRPGDKPFTLVRGGVLKTSPFGETDMDIISPEKMIKVLGSGTVFDDEYENGVVFEGTVIEALNRLHVEGFTQNDKFPACLRPDQLEVFIEVDENDMVEMIILRSKTDTIWDEDMRDGVIAYLPYPIGDNIGESCWEVECEISQKDMSEILVKAGYTLSTNSHI